MKYVKPTATVILFDNTDVITASNCGHKTSGNSCKNGKINSFDFCHNKNHINGAMSMSYDDVIDAAVGGGRTEAEITGGGGGDSIGSSDSGSSSSDSGGGASEVFE